MLHFLDQEHQEYWLLHVDNVFLDLKSYGSWGHRIYTLLFDIWSSWTVAQWLDFGTLTELTPDQWAQELRHSLNKTRQLLLGKHQIMAEECMTILLPLRLWVFFQNPKHTCQQTGNKMEIDSVSHGITCPRLSNTVYSIVSDFKAGLYSYNGIFCDLVFLRQIFAISTRTNKTWVGRKTSWMVSISGKAQSPIVETS